MRGYQRCARILAVLDEVEAAAWCGDDHFCTARLRNRDTRQLTVWEYVWEMEEVHVVPYPSTCSQLLRLLTLRDPPVQTHHSQRRAAINRAQQQQRFFVYLVRELTRGRQNEAERSSRLLVLLARNRRGGGTS